MHVAAAALEQRLENFAGLLAGAMTAAGTIIGLAKWLPNVAERAAGRLELAGYALVGSGATLGFWHIYHAAGGNGTSWAILGSAVVSALIVLWVIVRCREPEREDAPERSHPTTKSSVQALDWRDGIPLRPADNDERNDRQPHDDEKLQ